MRVALVNPPWSFEGSIYFGCREPHLPLELGYTRALLEARGHEARIIDAQLEELDLEGVRSRVEALAPDATVVVTAPSYLFWRCAPPELTIPMRTVRALREIGGRMIGVGPHASTTPRAALRKLGVDVVVIGECEEIVVKLVEKDREQWESIPSICYGPPGGERIQGEPHQSDMRALPALSWDPAILARHGHHHHRFDRRPAEPGGELEASRGCPYACTFCAKQNFRDKYRKRPLEVVLQELDGMIESGVRYVYFVDEIFLPDETLLRAVAERDVAFGVQLRIDNWSEHQLDLLGMAGCVSIEAGVESITPEGRSLLRKKCKLTTEELSALLIHAKKSVPFVQANLLDSQADDPADVRRWRDHLRANGVWANDPVPLFPYPGSPDYGIRWGRPDDDAWERAVDHYLTAFERMSDIQEAQPRPLRELERA
ncbi:MAG: TIGR04295 family B12-binding domain-containing radical SAM protein [Myxococcota bacterium]|nr:TIGR04295 family B12-binding domain-containing radical SAM protein [Myxococcota bacterium]